MIVAAPSGLLDLPGLGVPGARARAERCVQSILEQPDPIGTEVVVVDDAGPAGVADHLETVFASWIVRGRLRLVRSPIRLLEAGPAWNQGVAAASGATLAFVDAHDWWRPGRLAALEPWLKRHDLVVASDTGSAEISSDWIRSFLGGNVAVPSSGVVRRALFDEVGGFSERRTGQPEYEFWIRCLLKLTQTDRRDRFGLMRNDHVLREAKSELPVPVVGEVARRVDLLKEAVTLLNVTPRLPARYWMTVAKRVRDVGMGLFRKK